jgi:hypothetical protein
MVLFTCAGFHKRHHERLVEIAAIDAIKLPREQSQARGRIEIPDPTDAYETTRAVVV